MRTSPGLLTLIGVMAGPAAASEGPATGWLSWRGSAQTGSTTATGLPEAVDVDEPLWTYPLSGRGAPVIADGRLYTLGYAGQGPDLQELLVCLDAGSGELLWDHRFNDFLSDVIYNRYSIGSPTVDPETGDVFVLTTAGEVCGFSAEGEPRWRLSMMERFGRLTFPNGRTGSPIVDGELVIVHAITASWGSQGPARDRFYAFDKSSGRTVWASTPGTVPKDSSFSTPVVEWRNGRRLLYAGTGCGHVVCVDARTGEPVWRFPMSIGGVNSSVVIDGDRLIAIHGRENLDSSTIGRMVAIGLGAERAPGSTGPAVLDASRELWRNDLCMFTSSPVLADGRLYQVVLTGELCCVDVETGALLWREKLAPDQLHASPLAGDGKLYVAMNNGTFFVIRPGDEGAEVLSRTQLAGNCLGAPSAWDGRIFVHTTERLYCFGADAGGAVPATPAEAAPAVGPATALGVVPSDLLVRPGDRVRLETRTIDAAGHVIDRDVQGVEWQLPPGLGLSVTPERGLVVPDDAGFGAGELTASLGERRAAARVRVVPGLDYREDFQAVERSVPHRTEPGVRFAFPPAHWIGAKLKWEVRDLDGDQVLAKTLDRALFQRTQAFIGHPDASGYTMTMDVMSDGNRRMMSTAGMINQRYLIALKGNHQALEISSNQERIKESVPFRWRPGTWYRLKSRVDLRPDGSAIVRARAWPRDEPEPEAWSIEVTHGHGHTHGAAGLYGFSPQSRFRVYIDNIEITPSQ